MLVTELAGFTAMNMALKQQAEQNDTQKDASMS
jgi:hypothetical protein